MKQKETLLQLAEKIIDATISGHLSAENIAKVKPELTKLAKSLSVTPSQALLFTACLNMSNDPHIQARDIARHFDCNTISILTRWCDIEELGKKQYICLRNNRDDDREVVVPPSVMDALTLNQVPQPTSYEGLTAEDWFDALSDLLHQCNRDRITYETMSAEIERLVDSNKELTVVQRIKFHHLDDDQLILFLIIMDLYIQNNDEHVRWHDMDDVFSDSKFRRLRRMLENEKTIPQQLGLIEFATVDGQVESDAWHLTDKAKEEFLSDITLHHKNECKNGLTLATSITPKSLFYNATVTESVARLRKLLAPENFTSVQERLGQHGMRKGFACIFYGAPGTGKTETVLQLAHETGRNIKMVDVPNLRSKWVGDTEKNIKEVFDSYRRMCQNSTLAPILLFNEADAVLCKRNEGATGSVDKMENALQNIILQEMETLDGIMIATTNLTNNLDAAFERRFLYKIEFPRPTPNESKHIWHAMLPDLSEDEAYSLASSYEFSGGQIENIARKQIVDSILLGTDRPSMEAIRSACDAEQFNKSKKKPIGFN